MKRKTINEATDIYEYSELQYAILDLVAFSTQFYAHVDGLFPAQKKVREEEGDQKEHSDKEKDLPGKYNEMGEMRMNTFRR